jgi:hypothetical protein
MSAIQLYSKVSKNTALPLDLDRQKTRFSLIPRFWLTPARILLFAAYLSPGKLEGAPFIWHGEFRVLPVEDIFAEGHECLAAAECACESRCGSADAFRHYLCLLAASCAASACVRLRPAPASPRREQRWGSSATATAPNARGAGSPR